MQLVATEQLPFDYFTTFDADGCGQWHRYEHVGPFFLPLGTNDLDLERVFGLRLHGLAYKLSMCQFQVRIEDAIIMSLPQPKVQMSLFDASMLLEHLFPDGDRYRLFHENILPVLWAKREALCVLYCEDNGRPAIEPVLALGATLLQFMEKVPDRKAGENLSTR